MWELIQNPYLRKKAQDSKSQFITEMVRDAEKLTEPDDFALLYAIGGALSGLGGIFANPRKVYCPYCGRYLG